MITKIRNTCIGLAVAALPFAVIIANTANHATQQAGGKFP
jgi:hypothetical protein